MTKAEVGALVDVAKVVKGIQGVLSVNPYDGVQVRWQDMPKSHLDFLSFAGDRYPWWAETVVDGVKFYALLTQEEYDEWMVVAS